MIKIKILHISASHENKELHAFSFHFKNVCKKLGYNIKSYSPLRDPIIISNMKEDEHFKKLYIGQQLFPLSRILEKYFPDANLIFIENPKFFFNNDVDIPVFYYHRDLKSAIYIKNPTYLGLRFWSLLGTKDGRPKGGQPELIELYHPEIWWNEEIEKVWLCHAISEDEFGELNKFKGVYRNRKGFAYMGSYKSVDEMMEFNTYHFHCYEHHKEIIDFIEKHNLASKFKRVNFSLDSYKQHLYKFDATIIIPAFDSWETRRLYEASYCGCIPILYIQNNNAKLVFKRQGYTHGKTCITFNNKTDLMDLDIYEYDLDEIRKNGREMVLERHTYEARIKELLEIINRSHVDYT